VTETSQIAQIAPIPPDWRHLVESFCTLGASDEQLAQLFSVSPETLAGWMAEIPDFADAVRCGRNLANADVANSLYQLAVGYSHRVERVLTGRDGPMTVSFLKRHPPSHVACKTWLENRRPQDWGRAAIKRKLQAWDDARDAAARQPSFLSDAALAALVVAHKEAGGRLDAEPAVDPVGAREWPRVDEPYGEAMGVCRTVVERVAAQGILGWFAAGARRGEGDREQVLDLVSDRRDAEWRDLAEDANPVQPGAPCVDFRRPASSARLALLEAGNRI
jgi:hypothetical protein